jgi:hypothetical protein
MTLIFATWAVVMTLVAVIYAVENADQANRISVLRARLDEQRAQQLRRTLRPVPKSETPIHDELVVRRFRRQLDDGRTQ